MSVLLSLGSNIGDRHAHIRNAIDALKAASDIDVLQVSHCYETEPLGTIEQSDFINLAVEIGTVLEPLELLNTLQTIEQRLGRAPEGPHWGPRIIDIDIVLWEDRVMNSPELTIPHAEFRKRAFVLAPLAEIAGTTVDPVSGLTIKELSNRPEAIGTVRQLDSLDH